MTINAITEQEFQQEFIEIPQQLDKPSLMAAVPLLCAYIDHDELTMNSRQRDDFCELLYLIPHNVKKHDKLKIVLANGLRQKYLSVNADEKENILQLLQVFFHSPSERLAGKVLSHYKTMLDLQPDSYVANLQNRTRSALQEALRSARFDGNNFYSFSLQVIFRRMQDEAKACFRNEIKARFRAGFIDKRKLPKPNPLRDEIRNMDNATATELIKRLSRREEEVFLFLRTNSQMLLRKIGETIGMKRDHVSRALTAIGNKHKSFLDGTTERRSKTIGILSIKILSLSDAPIRILPIRRPSSDAFVESGPLTQILIL